jgi:hypothetical protein
LTREDGGIMKNMSFDAKNSQNEKREREKNSQNFANLV